MKIRLVAVQGSTNLVNVLSILKYQKEKELIDDYKDYLICGGMYTYHEKGFFEAIHLMAVKAWNFEKIIHVSDVDLNNYQSLDFAVQFFKALFLDSIDILYLCRNYQGFNEALIAAFPNAYKICYGDGYGVFDYSHTNFQFPEFNEYNTPKIDEANLILTTIDRLGDCPEKVFNHGHLKLLLIPQNKLVETITELVPVITGYISDLGDISRGKTLILLTLSNYTESASMLSIKKLPWYLSMINKLLSLIPVNSKFIKFIDTRTKIIKGIRKYFDAKIKQFILFQTICAEVSMYYESFITQLTGDEFIIIKSHPRESFEQAERLAERLKEEGFTVVVVPKNYSYFPTELFGVALNNCNFECMNSSSAIGLTLLKAYGFNIGEINPCMPDNLMEKYLTSDMCKAIIENKQKLATLCAIFSSNIPP